MKIEIRNNKVVIDGYVNAVERFSKVLVDKQGKFIEKMLPGVFRRALEKNNNVEVLLNHDKNRKLASIKDGTLELYEDNIGLRAIVEIDDEEVIEKGKKGKLRGWSFGFICNKQDRVKKENGIDERTVRDIDLFEVSIIDDRKIPAYVGTSIELRDSDEIKVVEYRSGEFDDATEDEKEVEMQTDFNSMTALQKREVLYSAVKGIFENGYLDDYDDNFVYVVLEDNHMIFKIPYQIQDGTVTLDADKKVQVIRGGYREVREITLSEQHPDEEVEEIDFSEYEARIKKIKEEF